MSHFIYGKFQSHSSGSLSFCEEQKSNDLECSSVQ